MKGTRRHAMTVGLLVCVPVLLFGAIPALAWQLADAHRSSDRTEGWLARERHPRVSQGMPVRITGTTRRAVSPGISSKVNLRFVNMSHRTVTLHHVRVRIVGIVAPHADAAHPCVRADFRIRQMPSRVLRVPSRQPIGLFDLGVLRRDWPRLTMLNRPVNQDGCKGASLKLGYRARGTRWP